LSNWFQTRRFVCEFPIGSYVKLSSAVEKRGDEIKKKSSPLKLLGQSQPNFAEMILGWSFFQNCVRHFIPPTKIAAIAELNLT
jgi:hypothetical protein